MKNRILLTKSELHNHKERSTVMLKQLDKREIQFINSKETLKIALRDYYLCINEAIATKKTFLADPEKTCRSSRAGLKRIEDQIDVLQEESGSVQYFLKRLEVQDAN